MDATTGVVIAGPDIVSRGFVYVKEAEALMEELRTISQMALDRCSVENLRDWNSLKTAIKGDVSSGTLADWEQAWLAQKEEIRRRMKEAEANGL